MRKREVSRTERLLNRMDRVIEDLKLDENALHFRLYTLISAPTFQDWI